MAADIHSYIDAAVFGKESFSRAVLEDLRRRTPPAVSGYLESCCRDLRAGFMPDERPNELIIKKIAGQKNGPAREDFTGWFFEAYLKTMDSSARPEDSTYAYFAQSGTEFLKKEAKGELLVIHAPYINSLISSRYAGYKALRDDLEAAGGMGLMKAIERYNPARGTFLTYATSFVRHEMQEVMRTYTGNGTRHEAEQTGIVAKAVGRMESDGREVTVRSLAEEIGKSEKVVERYLRQYQTTVVPLTELEADGQADTCHQMEDLLVKDAVHTALGRLTKQESDVIKAHYFEQLSRNECAARFGLTPNAVKTICARALEKLRKDKDLRKACA